MAITMSYSCSCGFHTGILDDAQKHANWEGHYLDIHGCLSPTVETPLKLKGDITAQARAKARDAAILRAARDRGLLKRVVAAVCVAATVGFGACSFDVEVKSDSITRNCRDVGEYRYAFNISRHLSKVLTTKGEFIVTGFPSGEFGTSVLRCDLKVGNGPFVDNLQIGAKKYEVSE